MNAVLAITKVLAQIKYCLLAVLNHLLPQKENYLGTHSKHRIE